MPPLARSRHARGEARPDYTGKLVLGLRTRVTLDPADDDIYLLVNDGDTPSALAARAWPSLRIPANRDPARPLGFSPAELWWVVLDLLELDDPLVPLSTGRRVRLPSADRVQREVLT